MNKTALTVICVTLSILAALFIYSTYDKNTMLTNNPKTYSNEFYSVKYPTDWEQVRGGWEKIDLPNEMLGLEDTIKNPVEIITLRAKVQSESEAISIFVVASPVNEVLKEIDKHEGNKNHYKVAQEYIDDTVATKSMYRGTLDDTYGATYHAIGKVDAQNEPMNLTVVIRTSGKQTEVTDQILASFKFSEAYKKDLYIKDTQNSEYNINKVSMTNTEAKVVGTEKFTWPVGSEGNFSFSYPIFDKIGPALPGPEQPKNYVLATGEKEAYMSIDFSQIDTAPKIEISKIDGVPTRDGTNANPNKVMYYSDSDGKIIFLAHNFYVQIKISGNIQDGFSTQMVMDEIIKTFKLDPNLITGMEMKEITERICHILEERGKHTTFLKVYGPFPSSTSLQETLEQALGYQVVVDGINLQSIKEMRKKVEEYILSPGYESAGPAERESNKTELIDLLNSLFIKLELDKAHTVTAFHIKEERPAYRVFWDFGYDINIGDKHFILRGSSSD